MAAKPKNDDLLKELMGVVSTLAESVKGLKEEVQDMKNSEQKAPSAEIRQDVLAKLEYSRDNHKTQMYKVMAYTDWGTDPYGNPRKQYVLPWANFDSYEKAKKYVDANPERRFDIIPL